MKAGTPVITSPLLQGTIGAHGIIIADPENLSDTVAAFHIALGTTLDGRHASGRA